MKIEKTTQFDRFKLLNTNRKAINRSHVNALKEAIEENNLLHLHPILVNSKMGILNGQHRFIAARELGVPIYFHTVDSSDDSLVTSLNLSLNWKLIDYLNYYVLKGYDEYIKLNKVMEKYNLTLSTIMSLTTDREGKYKAFRVGNFTMSMLRLKSLDGILKTLEVLIESTTTKKFFFNYRFWCALNRLVSRPDFDEAHWLENVSLLAQRFVLKPSFNDYYLMIIEIYNHNLRKKVA